MICCYIRSSSIGSEEFCQMKYALVYNFGFKDKQNKKAILGQIVHRAMQVLGDKSIAKSNGKRKVINDDIPSYTLKQCDDIDTITKHCFDYYVQTAPELTFDESDLATCIKWMNKAITYNGGKLDPRNQNVVITEKYFEIELTEPWAKYSHVVGDTVVEGNLILRGTIDLIIKEDEDYYQVIDYKGLPIETPIPTPDGWSTMGDLKVGDYVFDRFGKQTKVIAKSTQKIKECYQIEFDDTSKAICDDEHCWKLANGSTVEIKNLKVRDYINVAKPIDCKEKDLPIDPYTLGIWLGDGRNRGGEISSADPFVFEEIERRGFHIGKDISSRNEICKARTVYGLTPKLRALNLLHNKHIPEIYLRASYDQRLDLLRGLMDSDGSANKTRKQCVFMNCTKQLSEGVKQLLLTLGQRPLLSVTKTSGFGIIGTGYPVSFRPININPFLLPVKRDKVKAEWGPGVSDRRQIVKIEKIGEKVTQCISVESEDKTYLCTESMIPTHNSGKRLNWATGKEKTHECFQKDFQLLLYYYALRKMHPDHNFYVSIYYINDGGIFDIVFDEHDYKNAENMIRQKFEYIKAVEIPRQISPQNTNWKCQKLCKFSEMHESGKTLCQFYHGEIMKKGYNQALAEHGNLSKLNKYSDGGGRIAKE